MLTKEECLNALEFFEKHTYDRLTHISIDSRDRILPRQENIIQRLIKEHFDNSWNFKRFKLHSDSTLKGFTKDELIDYIHMIYHNWKVIDGFYESEVNYTYKMLKENEKLENQLVEIKSRLSRVESSETRNEPLKFEELKEGMWIWDNKFECYEKIHGIDKYLGIMFENGFYGEWFEENRFYLREVKE